MADKTGSIIEVAPNAGAKMFLVTTSSASAADTVAVTLANYGMSEVWMVLCQVHTTSNSVMLTEVATTAVSGGVLTITIPAGNDAKIRGIVVIGR